MDFKTKIQMKENFTARSAGALAWTCIFRNLLAGAFMVQLFMSVSIHAQTNGSDVDTGDDGVVLSNFVVDRTVFGGGIFYFAIVEVETDEVILRGTMDVEGVDRVILAPNTSYRFLSFYAETLSFGYVDFTTPPAGRTFIIPCMDYIEIPQIPDIDNDLICDALENIAGTDPDNPDTDGDSFLDGNEIRQGTNPLDGFVQTTGILASGPTPAPALDICAINNIVMVACGEAGVSVFNVRNGDAPTRIAQVNTPGAATAVTCFGNLIGVADGPRGVAVIDISDPPQAFIRHQLNTPSPAVSITARGNFAFVGLQNGHIMMVDMITGIEVSRYTRINTPIQDLGERAGILYILSPNRLYTTEINGGDFTPHKTLNITAGLGAGRFRLRLFTGDNFLYAIDTSGYSAISISDPLNPSVVEYFRTNQRGWKQIHADGSGLAVATVSPNSTPDGPHHVDLYRVGENNVSSTYLATFETPGIATALALYNGRAYIADGAGGLQVLNYLGADTAGQPPEITIEVQSTDGTIEEGQVFSVKALVKDDVQIRNVEFFINGEAVALDGSFPFELALLAPLRTPERQAFSIHAVVTDTGGNATSSETQSFDLVPDATPPRVRSTTPSNGDVLGRASSVLIYLSEPVVPSSINRTSIQFTGAGEDGIAGTGDDVVPEFTMEYNAETATIGLIAPDVLPPDLYNLRIASPLRDLVGNTVARPFVASFRIYGFEDRDRDGVPDDLEPELGLDPDNPDTNGNGIPDGKEDFDRDKLSNSGEVVLVLDPRVKDTDGNGIQDGDEDNDLDTISNGDEINLGTNPLLADSDGDLYDDATEITEGTNPVSAESQPPVKIESPVISFINSLDSLEVGEPLMVSVSSPVVSFGNFIPGGPGEAAVVSLASPIVSFGNFITSIVDVPDVTLRLGSQTVSFLNASPSGGDSSFRMLSPILSYFNGEPAPQSQGLSFNSLNLNQNAQDNE